MATGKHRWALGVVALLVVFGTALGGMSQASPGTYTDTDTTIAAPGIDITSVSHSDTGSAITWKVHTARTFDNNTDFFKMTWNLDLNSNGTYCEPGIDASIQLSASAGALVATLKPGCTGSSGSATATTSQPAGGGEDIMFSFDNQQFRTAVSFPTGTTYQYQVKSLDNHSNSETVPATTHNPNFITHSGVALAGATAAPTTTPSPTATATGSTPTPTATATAAGATATPTPTPTATVRSSTSTRSATDPTATPLVTPNKLPLTGANIMGFVVVAGALLYAGIELIGARHRMDDDQES